VHTWQHIRAQRINLSTHYNRTGVITIIVSLFLFLRLFLSHLLGLDHDQLDHHRMCA
jgi:hypothetical protein